MSSAKIKILFIITHLELGGAQKQLLSIIKNLDQSVYSIYLCAGERGYLRKEFANLTFVRTRFLPSLIRTIHPLYDAIAFLKLYFYIKKNRFDIVHTHSPKASLLGRWAAHCAGVRNIIYTVHGWPFHINMNCLWYGCCRLLEKMSAAITDKIIVVSNADLKTGVHQGIAPANKFQLIHYGIELDRFSAVYVDRKKMTSPKKIVFTISALKSQKGIDDFLKVAVYLLEHSPHMQFVIAGDGPQRKHIERMIKAMRLENNVSLCGWTLEIPVLFREASVFVLTSLWEGLPVSLIEAVVSGIPVVVTDTGGVADIVEAGKYGFVVQSKDVLGIKSACEEILKNYEKWSRIVVTNRDSLDCSYWSAQRMVKDIRIVYEGVKR